MIAIVAPDERYSLTVYVAIRSTCGLISITYVVLPCFLAALCFCAPYGASPKLLPKPYSVYGYTMPRRLLNTKPFYNCVTDHI